VTRTRTESVEVSCSYSKSCRWPRDDVSLLSVHLTIWTKYNFTRNQVSISTCSDCYAPSLAGKPFLRVSRHGISSTDSGNAPAPMTLAGRATVVSPSGLTAGRNGVGCGGGQAGKVDGYGHGNCEVHLRYLTNDGRPVNIRRPRCCPDRQRAESGPAVDWRGGLWTIRSQVSQPSTSSL